MAEDTTELDALITKLRSSRSFVVGAMPAAAAAVGQALKATAAAGTSPSGEAWEPRKKDGGRALANAASAIQVTVSGTTIIATLSGPEARHNSGTAAGKVVRQILPTAMTPAVQAAIKGAIVEAWEAQQK